MFFLILVCTFYSTKKLIGEVIGTMACVGDLKCWNVNDALHVHLMSLL